MRKLNVFNFTTLNGFYKGIDGDISWHRHGAEESDFASNSMESGGSTLLFGRVTYEMMASYWPTAQAAKENPAVAEGMNKADKIVFSRSLKKVDWPNTRIVRDMVEEVKKLKASAGPDLTLLGSGSILTQLAGHGLVDGFQFMIDPVALGAGTPVFHGLGRKLDLKLTDTRAFKSGVVLVSYVVL
ncbi:MAG TPA: dihydrofolate reductase family protein [Chryseosolibacter sp.]|nr:dihydrofolate reductase family protein [Chryseosolibacter sp.]